jgi:hypothetical protein
MQGGLCGSCPHPIGDASVIGQFGYDMILEDIQTELDNGRIVYVHCWAGVGRTGTVIGCRLIDGGLDYKEAIVRLAELRAGTRRRTCDAPQTASQHHLLSDRSDRPILRRDERFLRSHRCFVGFTLGCGSCEFLNGIVATVA